MSISACLVPVHYGEGPITIAAVDPSAVRDFCIAWNDYFTETIDSAIWTLPVGLVKGPETVYPTLSYRGAVYTNVCVCRISGFLENQSYTISCLASTVSGQEDTRSFIVPCEVQ